MKKSVIILFVTWFLVSCNSEIDLDKLGNKILSFSELPSEAKKLYQYKSEGEKMHNAYNDCYSDDQKFAISVNTITTNEWFSLIRKGFHHIIKINEVEFILDANKGKPFVLLNRKLYYSQELNLSDWNLKKSKFIEIDLRKYLK